VPVLEHPANPSAMQSVAPTIMRYVAVMKPSLVKR
jgi:hypothetical protein